MTPELDPDEVSVPIEALRTWLTFSSVDIHKFDREPWTKRKILVALAALNHAAGMASQP